MSTNASDADSGTAKPSKILGIDLGTTNSAMAVWDGTRPCIILTADNHSLIPSIVGITDERPAFTPAAHEVEEVIEVSIEDLQDASNIRRGTRTREGIAIEYPYFDLRGNHVWGATAMILGELISLLATA